MEKAGLRLENIVNRSFERNGTVHDVVTRGVFADEWRSVRGRTAASNAYLL